MQRSIFSFRFPYLSFLKKRKKDRTRIIAFFPDSTSITTDNDWTYKGSCHLGTLSNDHGTISQWHAGSILSLFYIQLLLCVCPGYIYHDFLLMYSGEHTHHHHHTARQKVQPLRTEESKKFPDVKDPGQFSSTTIKNRYIPLTCVLCVERYGKRGPTHFSPAVYRLQGAAGQCCRKNPNRT